MKMEYWDKLRGFMKWLIPFAVAVFLLFGCSPKGTQADGASETAAAETIVSSIAQGTDESAGTQAEENSAGSQTKNTAETSVKAQAEASESEEEAKSAETGTESQTIKETADAESQERGDAASVTEDGRYTSKEEVALYLYTYGHLPENFITKKEAEAAGWISREGNLWEVAPGMSIGGSRFGNYEGALPDAEGRVWYECDINFDGTYRGAERLVYSNDGLIYYTGDHYETFEMLYE